MGWSTVPTHPNAASSGCTLVGQRSPLRRQMEVRLIGLATPAMIILNVGEASTRSSRSVPGRPAVRAVDDRHAAPKVPCPHAATDLAAEAWRPPLAHYSIRRRRDRSNQARSARGSTGASAVHVVPAGRSRPPGRIGLPSRFRPMRRRATACWPPSVTSRAARPFA